MRDLAAAVLVAPAGLPEFRRRLAPYLDHVGVPHRINPRHPASAPLIIIGHEGFAGRAPGLHSAVLRAVRAGAGLVSFDPAWPTARVPNPRVEASVLRFSRPHWITAGRAEDRLALVSPLPLRRHLPGDPLIESDDGAPLLTVARLGAGRIVRWAGTGWMDPAVLGPLGGLDGALWRSLVWAARKPFVIRALPPLVAMRVDDVAGTGGLRGRSPLWWVAESRRAGFRPWLGLFTHNLSPAAVNELRPALRRGDATAFPHALGRIAATTGPRLDWHGADTAPVGDGPDGFGRTDAFIYWDHAGRRPWGHAEARRRLDLAESWWARARWPMSKVFLPHWYEAGHNVAARVHDRWGATLTSTIKHPASALQGDARQLAAGPFRSAGTTAPATPHTRRRAALARRPVYYADDLPLGGRTFFNCITEVRDLGGYEWTPNSDAAGTIARGVGQVSRALDSLALGVLFTHETDHLWKIPPATLRTELHGVARGLADRRPEFVTLDAGIAAVRATRTARIAGARLDRRAGTVTVHLSGRSDVGTSFRVYTEAPEGPRCRTVRVPPFRGRRTLRLRGIPKG